MPVVLIIGLAVAALLAISLVWSYNKLVKRGTQADSAWANIDTHLRRRADLIPNLVETVKGYASHEQETLQSVIEARGRARKAQDEPSSTQERVAAEQELSQALVNVNALTEQYPDLKADTTFAQLQDELTNTENKVAFARQAYNDAVRRYENARRGFPAVLVARGLGFAEREYFDEVTDEQRQAPEVSF